MRRQNEEAKVGAFAYVALPVGTSAAHSNCPGTNNRYARPLFHVMGHHWPRVRFSGRPAVRVEVSGT